MEKILIVDDDDELRGNITAILKDNGFTTEDASSGQEAINLLKFNNYSVIRDFGCCVGFARSRKKKDNLCR